MKFRTFIKLKQVLLPYRRYIVPLLGHYVCLCLRWNLLKGAVSRVFLKQERGVTSYTVVSACFNVEDYIDYFLKSLVNQTLDFKKNIKVVLVDDGSSDKTWEKITLWQKQFPSNITALRQPNGGQARARNLGISYASSEWITFADPDDFYDPMSFRKVDEIIAEDRNGKIAFISLNFVPFYEDKKGFLEDHPLRYRFLSQKKEIKTVSDSNNFIQMSANSLFIKKERLKRHRFSTNVKPTFEDSYFVNSIFLDSMNEEICFSREAKYYYRKRRSHTSSLDTCWAQKTQFNEVLENGVLALLKKSQEKFEEIPSFIQNVSIYHIQYYFRRLKNQDEKVSFLSESEIENFISLIKKCFDYISPQVFYEFSLPGLTKDIKDEIFFFFWDIFAGKGSKVFPNVYISSLLSPKEVRLQFLVRSREDKIEFWFGEKRITPLSVAFARNTICRKTLSYWCITWLSLEGISSEEKLRVVASNCSYCFSVNGNIFPDGITINELASIFWSTSGRDSDGESKYSNCWLISDRDSQADDNGEHFYRYLQKNASHINAWFLLNKNSHDWKRLKEDNFKLIAYGSRQHKKALQRCSRLISSHADDYVINSFNDQTNRRIPFIFLQHGIIKDDLSNWLNPKRMRLMLTSTVAEKASIIDNESKYQYGEKEIILTGLPRHDSLLKKNYPEKIILVMPTWRNYLVGDSLGGTKRSYNPNFFDSSYAKAWRSFLGSSRLADLLRSYGYRLQFFPHFFVQSYLPYFSLPSHIEICRQENHSFQEMIGRASLMITDYSSAAFEMAYLEKPVIYYQFDRDEIFQKVSHTYQKGYFEYHRDGFGPVVESEETLLEQIEFVLAKGCLPEEIYLERMRRTFPYKDGRCSERVYKAIQSL